MIHNENAKDFLSSEFSPCGHSSGHPSNDIWNKVTKLK